MKTEHSKQELDEPEENEGPPNLNVVKNMAGMQAMFRSIPREKYQAKYFENKASVPAVGKYYSRFNSIEPNVMSPKISPKNTNAEKVAKLKELHFKRDVKVCPRIDRALVYIRNNVFNSLKKNK